MQVGTSQNRHNPFAGGSAQPFRTSRQVSGQGGYRQEADDLPGKYKVRNGQFVFHRQAVKQFRAGQGAMNFSGDVGGKTIQMWFRFGGKPEITLFFRKQVLRMVRALPQPNLQRQGQSRT